MIAEVLDGVGGGGMGEGGLGVGGVGGLLGKLDPISLLTAKQLKTDDYLQEIIKLKRKIWNNFL